MVVQSESIAVAGAYHSRGLNKVIVGTLLHTISSLIDQLIGRAIDVGSRAFGSWRGDAIISHWV